MAQLKTAQLQVLADVTNVRRNLKRVIKDAQEANRELAQLEERLDTLGADLARYGIGVEVST